MRILNWNILAGGGNRVCSITERISSHSPDICVITEFRSGKTGNAISEKLAEIGYKNTAKSNAKLSQNSVMIFSKVCFDKDEVDIQVPKTISSHMVCTQIDGVIFIGVFCATPQIGICFVEFLCELVNQYPNRSILVAGDLYFGARASNAKFSKPLEILEAKGWWSSWKLFRNNEVVWSFQGGRGKSQPDHIYLYGPITERLVHVDFSMDELANRISDHAPMIAVFGLDKSRSDRGPIPLLDVAFQESPREYWGVN